eukprot:gene36965-49872_t
MGPVVDAVADPGAAGGGGKDGVDAAGTAGRGAALAFLDRWHVAGVVFAICFPDVDVSCVDTVGKKAAFIQQVAVALQLRNLHGMHARVETLTTPFDLISCRAFASLLDFVTWSRSALVAPHGVWLAMKGKHPGDALATLASEAGAVDVFHVEQLQVPGLDAERCIVWMRPATRRANGARGAKTLHVNSTLHFPGVSMFGIADYGAFAAAIVVFLLIPGPGNLALVTSTSKGGIRGGLAATFGVIAGDQVLMWLAVAGVAALLAAYPAAFSAVQWLGAAYLA